MTLHPFWPWPNLSLLMVCAGEYSAERLQQLRANAGHYTGPRAPMSTVDAQPEESNGGGFKLSGSFKPAGSKKDERFDSKVQDVSSQSWNIQLLRKLILGNKRVE